MVRLVEKGEREEFDKVAVHPLQIWTWGELRKSSRVEVLRLGEYEGEKLKAGFQVTLHKLPGVNFKIGYCPKSVIPSKEVARVMMNEMKKRRVIMVKFEPNVLLGKEGEKINDLKNEFLLTKGKSLFTKFTFWLDLTKSEEELMKGMKSKTRYNVRLAERKGVKIVEDSTSGGFSDYWKLMEKTIKRQAFYAHDQEYHKKMWEELRKAGKAHLLKAVYGKEVLAAWILFELNKVLYYPYGASSDKYRELMASNLLMWEVIRFGKKKGCGLFDMWGSLGRDPDRRDPWYGFHKFKEGYGAELVEFVGSWDLVINVPLYLWYRVGNGMRWVVLRFKKKFLK